MIDRQRNDELAERQDQATDTSTLDEIEDNESVSTERSDSPSPSPDKGSGQPGDDDSGAPI